MEENNLINNVSKVPVAMVARLAVLVIAVINQALVQTGKLPFELEDDVVYNLVSSLATILSIGVATWKNNSFTKEAKKADLKLKEYKGAKTNGSK